MPEIKHIDISTVNEFMFKKSVKINNVVIYESYFSRRITSVITDGDYIVVKLQGQVMHAMTNDQSHAHEDVFVVDTIEGVAPTSLSDLASKIAAICK